MPTNSAEIQWAQIPTHLITELGRTFWMTRSAVQQKCHNLRWRSGRSVQWLLSQPPYHTWSESPTLFRQVGQVGFKELPWGDMTIASVLLWGHLLRTSGVPTALQSLCNLSPSLHACPESSFRASSPHFSCASGCHCTFSVFKPGVSPGSSRSNVRGVVSITES